MNSLDLQTYAPMREIDFDMISQFQLPCRCCGKPVDFIWQKQFGLDNGSGFVVVTCWNPECKPRMGGLYSVTREIRNWLGDEVAKEWNIRQLPDWKVPDGLLAVLSYIERRDNR